MTDRNQQSIEKYKQAACNIGWSFLRKSEIKDRVYIQHSVCGQEQNVHTSNLCAGTIKCKNCQIQGYRDEAAAKRWEWLGMDDHTYSRYRHWCGHEQSIQTSSMQKKNPMCENCQNEKLSAEAVAVGWKFIRKVDALFGEYSHIVCGNIKKLQPSHVRNGNIRCEHCFIEEKRKSASGCGFEFIKSINGYTGEYLHNCGNISTFQFAHMRSGSVKCKYCYESSLSKDADGTEWQWLSRSSSSLSKYRHVCGHEQNIRHDKFRNGNSGVVCRSCQLNWYDKESNIYVMVFSSQHGKAVKVGFAKSHERRLQTFKVVDGVTTEIVLSVRVGSGREAILKEKDIHRKIKHMRLPYDVGKMYIQSGFTEIYPFERLDEIKEFVQSECGKV